MQGLIPCAELFACYGDMPEVFTVTDSTTKFQTSAGRVISSL
jgi:hypothetical protein